MIYILICIGIILGLLVLIILLTRYNESFYTEDNTEDNAEDNTEDNAEGKYNAYIITLERLKDRQEYIKNTMKYPYEFYFGVDGKLLTDKEKREYCDPTKMTDGQIGIFLSHKTLWEKIKDDDGPTLIMEDDATIIGDIDGLKLPDNFDIVYFGSCYNVPGEEVLTNVYKSVNPICMHGYLISKEGIKKMLNFFNNLGEKKVDKDFDNFYVENLIRSNQNPNKLTTYSIFPNIIVQNNEYPTTSERKSK